MIRHVLLALLYGSLGTTIAFITLLVTILEHRPDLEVWHTADLDAEFTATSGLQSFDDYLALENRLFAQLDEQVYSASPADTNPTIERYSRGSLSDPSRWPRNWNRSFELSTSAPAFGVLLLHGMSDSPYSMRSLAQHVHGEGAYVVGMRVPGHGTAPVGLVHVEWEDMAAAVELGVAHLREKIGDRPLVIIGYSNGGALAVNYALSALEDAKLSEPDALVLLSPEIGVAKVAFLAAWQERLGHLLGLGKLSWNSIQPEYDPYKYGSFSINAGKQAYRLTNEIQQKLTALESTGALGRFPRLLAFQSVVDATVSASALVERLYQRLPNAEHELVLFDFNRNVEIDPLLKGDPSGWVDSVFKNRELTFTITLVTNESPQSEALVGQRHTPGRGVVETTPLGLSWPPYIYSLSHVALPFPPDDPLYGGPDSGPSPGIKLGNVALRGERGALQVSGTDLLRLRWNPFHAYVVERTLKFMHSIE